MIRFKCLHCGKAISVKDEVAGKKGKCPGCGQTIEVPRAGVQKETQPAETSKPLIPHPSEPKQEIIEPPLAQPPQLPTHSQTPFVTGGQTQHTVPMPAPVAVQVNVDQSHAAHSLGIASFVLGILSFFVCWIPLIGFGFGGLGLVLGIIGLILAVVRKGSGIGYSIAGIAVSSIAVIMGICFMLFITGSSPVTIFREAAREASRRSAEQGTTTVDVSQLEPAAIRSKIEEVEKEIAALWNTQHVIVDSASFYWDDESRTEPIIEVSLTNNSGDAVKRVFFHGILKTPGRSLPWVEDTFNYEPRGGVEPGESLQWKLAPNRFGDWGDAPNDRYDMVFNVVIESYETASGQEIDVKGNADRIRELKKQLAELRTKLPAGSTSPSGTQEVAEEATAPTADLPKPQASPNEQPPTGKEAVGSSSRKKVITKSEYDRIRKGMSYRDVVMIIGAEGEELSQNRIEGEPGVVDSGKTIMYMWQNSDGSRLNILFQNDKLTLKTQFGLK